MYNFKRGNLYENYFSKCLTGMHRRGPDDQQLWHNNENYIAGFVRLSIRDLSINGRQPMFSSCGNYCITFNGEIYNTDTLKNLLQSFGITYHSSADTEVLLYAIMHLGIEKAMHITDGIFAIAFYDLQRNRLILARDRVGVKPLYIGMHENGVVYSSQYDHIINHPYCRDNNLNGGSMGSYLQLGYIPEDAGIIEKTKLLLHGHYYIVEEGKVTTHCYYNYGSATKHADKHKLEEIICGATQSQLVSDVPVGTFMSGGVDSTLVTYCANKKQAIQSFTIGVNNKDMNEADAAAQFAAIFNTKHDCRYIDEQVFLPLIQDHFKAFSEPFADYSSIPTLLLSAFAKEKVTVALSGDGGDELFWGYPRNRKVPALVPFYEKNIWTRRMKLLWSKAKKPAHTDISKHWNKTDFAGYYYSALHITGAEYWLPKILETEPLPAYHYTMLKKGEQQDLSNVTSVMELVRKMEVDIHLQRILLKVDRASMFHSLEVRVPLLSNSMLDLSESYNYKDCIADAQGKMNLKKLLAAKAGNELAFAPKKGFTIPLDDWLRNVLNKEVTEKIMDMPAHIAPLFNRKQLQQLLQQYMHGQTAAGWLVWALYCLVQWDAMHKNKIAA
nr:asparagine synthase (glutamine-hydrolyzing) [Panacibacter ginsenosidivorans]